MQLHFSRKFEVDPKVVEKYGAFDISVVSDLPLFIDPFLLFNSKKKSYQRLHADMIRYLLFLKGKAAEDLAPGLIADWYQFKEVKQNWLGFTLLGNGGHALGPKFAGALHQSLGSIFSDFGEEPLTKGSHLEKLCLIRGGVGRDSISDFTTNLIKQFLLEYTQRFARRYINPSHCFDFSVARTSFNYVTESWEARTFYLPAHGNDFVLLTPVDMLTRDESWINYPDMVSQFRRLPDAVPNNQLRAQINRYFESLLSAAPTAKERQAAAGATISHFPMLVDLYIKLKEDDGDQATSVALSKVHDTHAVLVAQVQKAVDDLSSRTKFFERPWWTSYDEALERVLYFKSYVEDQDGYRLITRPGRPFSREDEVQLFFGLIWCGSAFDANREVNNGRGPVDFKASFGSGDKTLIEIKLASSSSLKRNLERQIRVYEAANRTRKSVKMIVCYTASDQRKTERVLRELHLTEDPSVVVIDARTDNKPSGSKA